MMMDVCQLDGELGIGKHEVRKEMTNDHALPFWVNYFFNGLTCDFSVIFHSYTKDTTVHCTLTC